MLAAGSLPDRLECLCLSQLLSTLSTTTTDRGNHND